MGDGHVYLGSFISSSIWLSRRWSWLKIVVKLENNWLSVYMSLLYHLEKDLFCFGRCSLLAPKKKLFFPPPWAFLSCYAETWTSYCFLKSQKEFKILALRHFSGFLLVTWVSTLSFFVCGWVSWVEYQKPLEKKRGKAPFTIKNKGVHFT